MNVGAPKISIGSIWVPNGVAVGPLVGKEVGLAIGVEASIVDVGSITFGTSVSVGLGVLVGIVTTVTAGSVCGANGVF
jgi:hypothetical protein